MTTVADPGDAVTIRGTWTASAPITAASVVATLRKPDGTTEVLTELAVSIVTPVVTATAVYEVPRSNSAAGWYHVDWEVSGQLTAVDPDSFYVRRSDVLV